MHVHFLFDYLVGIVILCNDSLMVIGLHKKYYITFHDPHISTYCIVPSLTETCFCTSPVNTSLPPTTHGISSTWPRSSPRACENAYIMFSMRDEKEGRKKQGRSNKQQSKATQHTQGIHLHVSCITYCTC